MNIIKGLFVAFIFLFIHGSLCNVESKTMFDAIIQKCASLKTYNQSELHNFKNQTIFGRCKDWKAISSLTSFEQFEGGHINNIRCLLYYESFISFCNAVPTSLPKNRLIFAEFVSENISNLEKACKNLTLLPKTFKNEKLIIRQVVRDEKKCKYLCSEYKGGILGFNIMCAKSYYYNNFKFAENISITPTEKQYRMDEITNNIIQKKVKQKDTFFDEAIRNFSIHVLNHVSSDNPWILNQSTVADFDDPILYIKGERIIDSHIEQTQLQAESQDIVPEKNNTDLVNASAFGENAFLGNFNKHLNERKHIQNLDNDLDADNTGLIPKGEKEYRKSTYKQKQNDVTLPEVAAAESQRETFADAMDAIKDDHLSNSYTYDEDMEGNSYFFTYFTFICVSFIIGYVGYHNKQKVVALLIEGRHSKRTQRERRPNSANYHKLDSTLEEAISSSCNKNTNYVIY